jgi:hypothetical protein
VSPIFRRFARGGLRGGSKTTRKIVANEVSNRPPESIDEPMSSQKNHKGEKMKKLSKKAIAGLLVLGSTVPMFAATSPTIKMPTPDYTNFYAGVGVVLGVSLVVMLAKRIKHFFR